MKTIDQDTIDFAEDFFFKLSDTQLKERVAEFKKRQGEIDFLFSFVRKEMRGKEQIEILWRLGLILDYCFNNCFGNLPVIKRNNIIDYYRWEEKVDKDFADEDDNIVYEKFYAGIGQEALMNLFVIKLNYFYSDVKILNESEANRVMLVLIAMGYIYRRAIEKMPSKGN